MKEMNKSYIRILIVVGFVVFSLNYLFSCSANQLTTKEAQIIENYTKSKNHDAVIIGEWIDNATWEYKGTMSPKMEIL